MVANAPTESCVSTVMTMSDQCACSGVTCVMSRGRAFGGRSSGGVMRVVERLPSPTGRPIAAAFDSTDARHSATFTISIASAPSGQALTHAGAWPSESRP